jgi:hypothetical protein
MGIERYSRDEPLRVLFKTVTDLPLPALFTQHNNRRLVIHGTYVLIEYLDRLWGSARGVGQGGYWDRSLRQRDRALPHTDGDKKKGLVRIIEAKSTEMDCHRQRAK